MKILFIHQNFPAQYKHLVQYFLNDSNNEVIIITEKMVAERIKHIFPRVTIGNYDQTQLIPANSHHYINDFENGVRRAQAVVKICITLRQKKFTPDIVCAHPGWGESLYIKDVFPDTPLLNFFEFFYHAKAVDLDFDPEFPAEFDDIFRARTKNAINLFSLNSCDYGLSPTNWQKILHPQEYHDKIKVIFDGINTDQLKPNPDSTFYIKNKMGNDLNLTSKDKIITYVSRCLEPYRGFHILMRTLPEILRRHKDAHILIVGNDQTVNYGKMPLNAKNWRTQLMAELGKQLDLSRIHFLGNIPYTQFINVLQVSAAHLYLTYPFVLSWSMLEAMSCGCVVVASDTDPVKEIITHQENGLLVNFFNIEEIVDRMDHILSNPTSYQTIKHHARQTIIQHYDLKRVCLPAHVKFIDEIIERYKYRK